MARVTERKRAALGRRQTARSRRLHAASTPAERLAATYDNLRADLDRLPAVLADEIRADVTRDLEVAWQRALTRVIPRGA